MIIDTIGHATRPLVNPSELRNRLLDIPSKNPTPSCLVHPWQPTMNEIISSLTLLMLMAVYVMVRFTKVIQCRRCQALATKYYCLDPVRRDSTNLVVHVPSRWHSEHIVEFCSTVLATILHHGSSREVEVHDVPSSDLCLVSGSHRKIMTNATAFIAA